MNVPFLERTLVRLKEAGIDDVILRPAICPKRSPAGSATAAARPEDPLRDRGNAPRYRRALKNIQQYITGPFFVLNGDVLTSLDLRAMRAKHEAKGGLASLHLIRVEIRQAFGCVGPRRKPAGSPPSSRSPSAKDAPPTR